MCEKAVDTCPFVLDCVPNCYNIQKMFEKAVSKEPFMLKQYLGKHNSQEMCGKAIDPCLLLLKFAPDLFVRNKMLQDLDDVVSFKDDIFLVNADSDNVSFFSNGMGPANADLKNDDSGLFFMLHVWLCYQI